MGSCGKRLGAALVGAAALFALAGAAEAATTLRILKPQISGNAGDTVGTDGLHSTNYYLKAYPGLEYVRQAVVHGGVFPYTFALTGEPSGMLVRNAGAGETCGVEQPNRVHVRCGEIYGWTPASDSSDVTPTLIVTDATGATASVTWTINADTASFRFVSATGSPSPTGNGTFGNPWLTLDDVYDAANNTHIVYLRSGTYSPGTMPISSADDVAGNESVSISSSGFKATQFVGYPGERPVIDFGYAGDGCAPWDGGTDAMTQVYGHGLGDADSPTFDCGQSVPKWIIQGVAITLVNLDVTNCMLMCFQVVRLGSGGGWTYGVTIHDVAFDGLGPGVGGSNSAFVMFTANNPDSVWDSITESSFTDINYGTGADGIKLYELQSYVMAHNFFDAQTFPIVGERADGFLAIKGQTLKLGFVLANDFTPNHRTGIGGNMSDPVGGSTGEITRNRVRSVAVNNSEGALTLGVTSTVNLGAWDVNHNTFEGRVVTDSMGSSDGPFTFTANVIANSGGSGGSCILRITCDGASPDYSRLVDGGDNLTGTSGGLLDADGQLLDRDYAGVSGYELQDEEGGGGGGGGGGGDVSGTSGLVPVRKPFIRRGW